MISRQGLGAWGVILAEGDGTRLQPSTAQIEADTRPKQFCQMLGDESLLTQTRCRISPLFHSDKIIAVVAKKHETYYSREFSDWPPTAVIVGPDNRGKVSRLRPPQRCFANLMLKHPTHSSLAAIPTATRPLSWTGLKRASELPRTTPTASIILGAVATYSETEYGWIEPVPGLAKSARFAPARVRQFWEKPTLATAQDLLRRGCLWNTFATIGRVRTFIQVLWQAAPNPMLALSAGILEDARSRKSKSRVRHARPAKGLRRLG